MDSDAFIVAFRSRELDLAGEVDAVDDVLEGCLLYTSDAADE